MSDSTSKRLVEGVPLGGRSKILRLCDHQANYQVDATFGLDILRAVLRDQRVTEVTHEQLKLDGFEVDHFTSRRWPHVKLVANRGSCRAVSPVTGQFHIGFMMYDDGSEEKIGIAIDDQLMGVAVANQNNNRTWLYWLRDPVAVTRGQSVELRTAGGPGTHGIINVLFMPAAPEQRRIAFRVENMKSATHVDRPDRVTVSWTTTWPSPTRFEYGQSTQYGQQIEDKRLSLVHRVVLDQLDVEATYHGRAIGQDAAAHRSMVMTTHGSCRRRQLPKRSSRSCRFR